MRVPLSWLREYVDVPADAAPEDVLAALVRVGFEEEDVHRFELQGPIVVGEVLEFVEEPQSNGKTIRWCQVQVAPDGEPAADGGPAVHGIVCGARNFFVGDKVAVTLPGSVLPGPFPIAARKTYGHVSDGMIASAKELGLGEEHNGILRLVELGIDAPVGTDAIALLGLDDVAVEINVTPDRGYALSIRGVAREYSHATGADFRDPGVRAWADVSHSKDAFTSVVDDGAPIRGRLGASEFVTRIVRDVDPTRPTPSWMVARLTLAGIRSLGILIDITNYVMLELGQPLHGYDLDTLAGGITVRRASAGEKLQTLDGKTRDLHVEDLLITDESGPIGLAGVMGGGTTEMTAATRNVLLEAATFDPVTIARTARRHKLPSEASRRFERGVDPNIPFVAAQRAVDLMVAYAGGTDDREGGALLDRLRVRRDRPALRVRRGSDRRRLHARRGGRGARDDRRGRPRARGRFRRVPPVVAARPHRQVDAGRRGRAHRGIRPHPVGAAHAAVGPRPDRRRSRVVVASATRSPPPAMSRRPRSRSRPRSRTTCTAPRRAGTCRASSSPTRSTDSRRSCAAAWCPALLRVAHRNVARGLHRSRRVRDRHGLPARRPACGTAPSSFRLSRCDRMPPPSPLWTRRSPRSTGTSRCCSRGGSRRSSPARPPRPPDSPTRSTRCARSHRPPASRSRSLRPSAPPCTRVAPACSRWARPRSAMSASFCRPWPRPPIFPVAWSSPSSISTCMLSLAGEKVVAASLSGYPAATQDVSLVVGDDVPAADVRAALVDGAGALLESLRLVDDYRGPGVPDGAKSLTFALRFRAPDRTLTAAEATEAKLAGVAAAAERYGATLRE